MKPSKQNANNSNNNNNKHLLPHTKSSKVNNFILNHEEAISRMNRHNKVNSPSSSRHSYNSNTNNNHLYNYSPITNINNKSNTKKKGVNNFNKFNDNNNNNNTQYNNGFRNQFLYYHLHTNSKLKNESGKNINVNNLLTPKPNNKYAQHYYSPNHSKDLNLNNIIISLNTELSNNNSNVIIDNNCNEMLKNKDKQIAKLQKELIRSQNLITKLKQEKEHLTSTISMHNLHYDSEDTAIKGSSPSSSLHTKMLKNNKSVSSLINSNFKSKQSSNCSYASSDNNNTLGSSRDGRKITLSPKPFHSPLNIGAYRNHQMNYTGKRFYTGSLNKHIYIDKDRNLVVVNNNKILKLKQRNFNSIVNSKTFIKKKSSSSDMNNKTNKLSKELSIKSGEYDSISELSNLNLTLMCDSLLKKTKHILDQYWLILNSKA